MPTKQQRRPWLGNVNKGDVVNAMIRFIETRLFRDRVEQIIVEKLAESGISLGTGIARNPPEVDDAPIR